MSSVLEPGVGSDGGFAAVSIVIKQLLAPADVPRGDEDEVGDAVDVVEFGLAVPVFAVIYQPPHSPGLLGSIHAVTRQTDVCVSAGDGECLIHMCTTGY